MELSFLSYACRLGRQIIRLGGHGHLKLMNFAALSAGGSAASLSESISAL